jgi:hypothetical protein
MHELERRIAQLEQSHDQLRGALILAGRELRKRQLCRRDSVLLAMLRRTLREARLVRKNAPALSRAIGR